MATVALQLTTHSADRKAQRGWEGEEEKRLTDEFATGRFTQRMEGDAEVRDRELPKSILARL